MSGGVPRCPWMGGVVPVSASGCAVMKSGLIESGLGEMGSCQSGVGEGGSAQRGIGEIGLGQVEEVIGGAEEIPIVQVGARQVDSCQIRDGVIPFSRGEGVAQQEFARLLQVGGFPRGQGVDQFWVPGPGQQLAQKVEGFRARGAYGPAGTVVALYGVQEVTGQEVLLQRGVGETECAAAFIVLSGKEGGGAQVLV